MNSNLKTSLKQFYKSCVSYGTDGEIFLNHNVSGIGRIVRLIASSGEIKISGKYLFSRNVKISLESLNEISSLELSKYIESCVAFTKEANDVFEKYRPLDISTHITSFYNDNDKKSEVCIRYDLIDDNKSYEHYNRIMRETFKSLGYKFTVDPVNVSIIYIEKQKKITQ